VPQDDETKSSFMLVNPCFNFVYGSVASETVWNQFIAQIELLFKSGKCFFGSFTNVIIAKETFQKVYGDDLGRLFKSELFTYKPVSRYQFLIRFAELESAAEK
jgi:hypothetical protein